MLRKPQLPPRGTPRLASATGMAGANGLPPTEPDVLCAIPKDLDFRLYHDLWSKGIPIVLTSGTLSAGGDFTRIKETLGLNHLLPRQLHSVTMPSPFDYKRNMLLYIADDMPFPNGKDKKYIAAVADRVEQLVTASHGHAAVLFTSYNAMGQVHALLAKRDLQFPLFKLERGGVHAIERFKKSGNGILFASGALWEGIDIPGDALSMLIMVKLPFPVPDPIGEYERSLCGDMTVYKNRVVVPDMQVREKQGGGRLIRTEKDTGCVALFDCRAQEGAAYHLKALEPLPKCEVTKSIARVGTFFREIKSPEYFM